MDIKEVVNVKESIEEIDSELVELWSKKDLLETKRQEIIKENPVEVLEIDLGIISKTLEVFNTICRNDYSNFYDAETYLNGLFHEIALKIERLEEAVPEGVVEEVEVESD